ncbi:copper chaperone PCu(A)C [Nocardiopsis potens]|uniref:copper chaperone PCu(A)C n=1 Tax=Nocardiopsis potens TaxID=1246458 RepID=UPI0003460492|nr:copper chaperone PCu(A)C [Nocardiopsis potens]
MATEGAPAQSLWASRMNARHIGPVDGSFWVRWLPGALPAAGYITLRNTGGEDAEVVKVLSPDYRKVAVRRTVDRGEGSEPVDLDTFTVPAGGEFAMAPGRCRLVLEEPFRPVAPGDEVRVMFILGNHLRVRVRFPVRASAEMR